MLNMLAITKDNLLKVVQPLLDVCGVVVPVLLSVVGALGTIWCVVLGVKYAQATDPQEHEKAKQSLKNSIIGFILIFVLLISLQVGINVFSNWWENYAY